MRGVKTLHWALGWLRDGRGKVQGMGILGRYVLRQTAGAVVLVLFSLTAVVWLATALKQLKLVVSQGQSFLLYLKMTVLVLPNLVALIAPIALLIATIHTLNRLHSDSELIVINASGGTVWRIAMPLIVLALLVSSAILVTNLYLQPYSMRTLHRYIVQVRTDLISQVVQPGEFTSPEENLTIHIRDRDDNGDLLGLILHDDRDAVYSTTYLAERARLQQQDGQSVLVMLDGHIQRRNKGDGEVNIIAFKSNAFDLSQFGPKNSKFEYKPRERYLDELLNPEPDDAYFKRFAGKFRSELHERFVSPLYPVVFVIIAVVCMGNARTTRHGWFWPIATSIALCAGVRVAALAATNLTTITSSGVPLMYAIPGLTIIIAAIAAHAKMSPKSGLMIGLGPGQIFRAVTRS